MSDRFDQSQEQEFETKPDEADGPLLGTRAVGFRGPSLITGGMPASEARGRRRGWSSDDKARIVFESVLPDANVSAVARMPKQRSMRMAACSFWPPPSA